jgi:AcrR family transcriptional regulator
VGAVAVRALEAPTDAGRGGGPGARERIIDAAIALRARGGAEAARIRAVAQAAGVSPGLVIYHFGTKEELHDACDTAVLARAAGERSPGTAADLYATLASDPVTCDYIARSLVEGSPAGRELFSRLVAAARYDVELGGDGDSRRAVQHVMAALGPLLLRRLGDGQSLPDRPDDPPRRGGLGSPDQSTVARREQTAADRAYWACTSELGVACLPL